MAVVFIVRIRPGQGLGTLDDVMAAAASAVHTVPPVPAGADAGSPGTDPAVEPPPPPTPPGS